MNIKALSLIQPWAQLIVDGRKTIETRTWSTPYRGALLICASKKLDTEVRHECLHFGYQHPSTLRYGETVCIATLTACKPFTREMEDAAMVGFIRGERRFGWVLNDVTPVPCIPIKGALGLFDPPTEVIDALRRHWTNHPLAPSAGLTEPEP